MNNWQVAKATMKEAAEQSNKRANYKKKNTTYNLGDYVMLWTEKISTTLVDEAVSNNHMALHKLTPKWIGPCIITAKLSDTLYMVHSPRRLAFEVHCHVQFLKPYDPEVTLTNKELSTPPLFDLVKTPDLHLHPSSIPAAPIAPHDVFDINFQRYLKMDENITPTTENFNAITKPEQDPRISKYFKHSDPSTGKTTQYKTYYINYRNDLKAQAIWFAPMVPSSTGQFIPGGPTRFCSLQEYDQHFAPNSQDEPFTDEL